MSNNVIDEIQGEPVVKSTVVIGGDKNSGDVIYAKGESNGHGQGYYDDADSNDYSSTRTPKDRDTRVRDETSPTNRLKRR